MRPEDLPTPCALVDLARLERNAAWAREKSARLGVALRPHVKTHKSLELARIQTRGLPARVTVSTLAEARAMVGGGFTDLTWAVTPAPSRLREAAGLARSVERVSVVVDGALATEAAEEACEAEGARLGAFVKVDCGYGRSGVDPRGLELLELAARISGCSRLDFLGVLTHAGQAYGVRGRSEAERIALLERDAAVLAAERLRDAGFSVPAVSLGSTPTFAAAEELGGATEVRPGNYLFFDAGQVALGSCEPGDCAFTVLATIVGCHPSRGVLVLDAGALALSKDAGPTHIPGFCGFGRILRPDGEGAVQGTVMFALSQEHGHVRSPGAGRPGLRVGDRLRIVPNHACLAAACFETYHLVEAGRVVGRVAPARGW